MTTNRTLSRDVPARLLLTAVMLALAVVMIVPFLWMISTSVKTPAQVFDHPIRWIPANPTWEHHLKVWTGPKSFGVYYWNSLKISLIGLLGAAFLSALAAYGFARIPFKGRNAAFILYLSMMMVPPQVLFVPKFVMFEWAGIYNTHLALILPGLFSIFGVFMLRQRWYEMLTGGAYDPMDADIAIVIQEIADKARTNLTDMQTGAGRKYLWSELAGPQTNPIHIRLSYRKLYEMALAYRTAGSALEGNTALGSAVIDGLAFLYDNYCHAAVTPYGNWWEWQIGAPLALNDTVVLMYEQIIEFSDCRKRTETNPQYGPSYDIVES